MKTKARSKAHPDYHPDYLRGVAAGTQTLCVMIDEARDEIAAKVIEIVGAASGREVACVRAGVEAAYGYIYASYEMLRANTPLGRDSGPRHRSGYEEVPQLLLSHLDAEAPDIVRRAYTGIRATGSREQACVQAGVGGVVGVVAGIAKGEDEG